MFLYAYFTLLKIKGKTLEDRKREEKKRLEHEEHERECREKEENKNSTERNHEIKGIREQYLGGGEKKRKIIKPSDKFAKLFQFDWDEVDDTSRNDLNPLYNNRVKINALYGRGYIAGVDQKEQRKDSNFLLSLSEKRMLETNKIDDYDNIEVLTEKQKQERLKARELATQEFKQRRLLEISNSIDQQVDNSLGKHWTDKALHEMTDRDWRIFREDFDIRIQGGRATLPLRYWKEGNFPSKVLKAIESAGYEKPSPIQRQAIPIGMYHKDIIGIAETGSGKTCAFVIPLVCYLLQLPTEYIDRCESQGPLAVIMAPTRELAQQIEEECIKLLKYTDFKTVAIVGGQSIEEQGFRLRRGVEIVVGTPGRMLDCIESNYLVLNQCNYVVLDEADRMIDMGFEPQVIAVLEAMGGLLKSEDEQQAELQLQQSTVVSATNRQIYRVTAMFSATMPPQVEQIARTYLRHPVLVRIGDEDTGKNKRIEQRVHMISESQKKSKLVEELKRLSKSDKVIVFVNHKKQGDSLGKHLETLGYDAGILHGGRSQDQREETLDQFRSGSVQVLVATDVAARGLDIPDVSYVINYDCPNKIQSYCHRIGRTGRAGKFGIAITFLTEGDSEIMYDLKNYLESTDTPVPHQLAHHAAAQAPVGARDDKGKLLGTKKDSVQYLRD